MADELQRKHLVEAFAECAPELLRHTAERRRSREAAKTANERQGFTSTRQTRY
jgi:hypothetical protein